MSRARGNARKKKTRLTEESLSAVMEVAPQRAPRDPAALAEAAPVSDASPASPLAPDSVVSSILELLRTEPDVASMPATYNDPGRVFAGAADYYPAHRYLFGLAVCPECRYENIYYQDREALARGYRFRCRICQHELLVTLPPDAPG